MFRDQSFCINQAKNRAKELYRALQMSSPNNLTVERLRILPEYSNSNSTELSRLKPKLKKCIEIIAKEAGFHNWKEVTEEYFWQLLTVEDMNRAIDSEPLLTPYGFGAYDSNTTYVTFKKNRIAEERATFPEYLRGFQLSCNWLRFQNMRKNLNSRFGTYSLKHKVENWASEVGISNKYVANGAFIAAVKHMGFRIKQLHNESPNGKINISSILNYPGVANLKY